MIRFEGAFRLVEPDGMSAELDASKDSWQELSALLSLRHDRIESVTADEDAQLTVEFISGRRIEAGPADDSENWQVTGPVSSSRPFQAAVSPYSPPIPTSSGDVGPQPPA